MLDLIIKKMELNEQYHQTKEKMAWVATSLFLTFTLACYKWLYGLSFDNFGEAFPTIFILSTVYLSALAFVSFQLRHRWQSVYESYALMDMLRKVEATSQVSSFPDLYKTAIEDHKAKKENRRRPFMIAVLTLFFPIAAAAFLVYRILGGRKDIINSRYHTEIPTYAIVTYFFILQLVAIF
jgi:cytochrome bd-type quinol oxidase subunit 2